MTDLLRKRLLYLSCYRGCKETDLLLGNFAKRTIHDFSTEDLEDYARFLEENDWDIYEWVTAKTPLPPRHHTPVIQRLLAFHQHDRESF